MTITEKKLAEIVRDMGLQHVTDPDHVNHGILDGEARDLIASYREVVGLLDGLTQVETPNQAGRLEVRINNFLATYHEKDPTK